MSDERLATTLEATWRAATGDELDLRPEPLDRALVEMDEDRTWSADVEADVAEGEDIYVELVHTLAARSGGALRVADVREDWRAIPGRVEITFRAGDREVAFSVPVMNDWIHPQVVHELNGLLGTEGPRFYFVDLNPQEAIVTRATREERAALERARPIRLLERSWWDELAKSFE